MADTTGKMIANESENAAGNAEMQSIVHIWMKWIKNVKVVIMD